MKKKIGVGVITCNRMEFFSKCINSVPDADMMVVVNDGKPYQNFKYPSKITELIQHEKNRGVGVSKNDALKILLKSGCEHIFLCEDDIMIKDSNIYEAYIKASYMSGIQHFNYAYHGPGNRNSEQMPISKKIVEYGAEPTVKISLNHNILGAFSYFSRLSLEKAGLIDERFRNAWEHVDHTYQIIKLGMHPPFWWFADIANSLDYIEDLHDLHAKSVIRKNKLLWKIKLRYNAWLFKNKNGFSPTSIPEMQENDVLNELARIQNKFGVKAFNK